jgi:hypothetical protein
MPRRIVPFVEGEGDVAAVSTLAARLLAEHKGAGGFYIDREPFRVGHLARLAKDDYKEWRRFLEASCRTRKGLAGILLVLDGDARTAHPKQTTSSLFCAASAAKALAEQARTVRAGEAFSVAVVFAMKEFESWLLSAVDSLGGVSLDGAGGIVPHGLEPPEKPEAIRDGKGELSRLIPNYSPTLHQGALAGKVSLEKLRERCRSFRRFDHAIQELIDAERTNRRIASPSTARTQ